MQHPIVDEIIRAKWPVQPQVLKRWQRALQEMRETAQINAEVAATKKGRSA
jgi:hypothetical protein